MWGDFGGQDSMPLTADVTFGKDTFVFKANNGQDTIYDFHKTDGDKIKLLEIWGIDATTISEKIALSADGQNSVISLSDGNNITVIGVTDLTVTDFIFA